MNLENFDVDDFLREESFFNWVKDPDSEDALFWESLLKNHPSKREHANQAKSILRSVSFQRNGFDRTEITRLWENIKNDTLYAEGKLIRGTNKVVFRPWKYLKVAAVILPFVIATVLYLFFREMPASAPELSQGLIEKYNPRGQKLTVFLSDGSKVKLNAESRLTYLKPFNENERVVHLEGEAFFEVSPDKSRPFIVQSGSIETKVLGTSFNVNAYPDENRIDVAVKTGKVSVMNKSQKLANNQNGSIVLSPAEMASYSKIDDQMKVTIYDPKAVLSWSEGTLYFDNATMEEFVAKLQRWYGIDIVMARQTPIKKGITGEFFDQSLEEILIGTHEASEFEYEFKDGKVIIK
jgi:ferric-dicitrate binding protein FerR (iron transport regulator)